MLTSYKLFYLIYLCLTFKSAIGYSNHIDSLHDYDDNVDDGVQIDVLDEEHSPDHVGREGRFLYYPPHPIVDMVLQTTHAKQANQKDPFEFVRDSYPLPKGLTSPHVEYDFIIIGGGSAGSVLAARLTENKPKSTVLLIEAGKPEMLLTDVPVLAPYFQRTDYTWQYKAEHQPGICLGCENQRCFWPRGKALGGTSVVNYMIYTRGRPEDWDRIAGDGNPGWSYNEVLKYYIKSEKSDLKDYKNSPYHGIDGEMCVTDVPFRTQLIGAFLKAGQQLGHPTVDYNSPEKLGFGFVQVCQEKGHRQSAAKAFLHPNKKRKNLHILTETRATKILIDPKTKRAYGVEYVRNKQKYTVRARKEVILSAGPIESPHLLMLSGIGPEKHLNDHGIQCLQNLNVGQTLYDHITFPGLIFLLNTTTKSFIEDKVNLQSFMQWGQFGDGLLTTPGGVEGIGYIKTNSSDDPLPVPNIELISLGGSIVSDGGGAIRKGMHITDDTYNNAFAPINNRDTWSALPMLLHPKSKGYMLLRDRNPFSFPKLYANYLTDRKDIDTFIDSIRFLIRMSETEPFQRFGAQLYYTDLPQCRHCSFNTDEYWECALRTLAVSLHHQIATCKMGPYTDPDAVVDSELRVYGIKDLRVIDSSIIPRTISGHTHAPAVMIGEKGADLIKKTWNLK